jgi:hypothetical protein
MLARRLVSFLNTSPQLNMLLISRLSSAASLIILVPAYFCAAVPQGDPVIWVILTGSISPRTPLWHTFRAPAMLGCRAISCISITATAKPIIGGGSHGAIVDAIKDPLSQPVCASLPGRPRPTYPKAESCVSLPCLSLSPRSSPLSPPVPWRSGHARSTRARAMESLAAAAEDKVRWSFLCISAPVV